MGASPLIAVPSEELPLRCESCENDDRFGPVGYFLRLRRAIVGDDPLRDMQCPCATGNGRAFVERRREWVRDILYSPTVNCASIFTPYQRPAPLEARCVD